MVNAPRPKPVEEVPVMPQPEGWATHYSTKSLSYRVNLALRACVNTFYMGEAVPSAASGDLAPNCLALFLGCRGVEMAGSVWCKPCFEEPEEAIFEYDPDNFYWQFSREVYRQVGEKAKGKFLQSFPDLIEGLDTLAAMRGSEALLQDLIDRPEWVHDSLRQITSLYFRYYDVMYEMIRDEVGGSVFWSWAPGRMTKLQCDFSAMISPEMFGEFMVPVLAEMTERVAHSMYHWDGPGALGHHDALLSLSGLDMLQWTPGAGVEPTWHERWWPIYHKTLDAGKKLYVMAENREQLLALKREFGEKAKEMLIGMYVPTQQEADACLKAMEF
jgi:hypothetical protein